MTKITGFPKGLEIPVFDIAVVCLNGIHKRKPKGFWQKRAASKQSKDKETLVKNLNKIMGLFLLNRNKAR
jgi:hypothetical protein